MKNDISQFHWHYVRYGWPHGRSVLLSDVPRDMRMSRRMRKHMKRLRLHILDIERQYHISDDVSEARFEAAMNYPWPRSERDLSVEELKAILYDDDGHRRYDNERDYGQTGTAGY